MLSTTTTGPFVPASRDTNKQRPRLLQAPPPIPAHRPGQTQAGLPSSGPYFGSSRTYAWTRGSQNGTTWFSTERNSCQSVSPPNKVIFVERATSHWLDCSLLVMPNVHHPIPNQIVQNVSATKVDLQKIKLGYTLTCCRDYY